MLPFPLDRFDSLLRTFGALGWSPAETLAMDVFVAASFLGHGTIGEDWDGFDIVIRGSRSLMLPKDDGDGETGRRDPKPLQHVTSVTGDDRRAAYATLRKS